MLTGQNGILNRGKFAQYKALSDWYVYNSEEKSELVSGGKKLVQSSGATSILLTTGATNETKLQNIYDIAGNVREWTLELGTTDKPCVYRGGSYGSYGSSITAKHRNGNVTSHASDHIGFRVGLWK